MLATLLVAVPSLNFWKDAHGWLPARRPWPRLGPRAAPETRPPTITSSDHKDIKKKPVIGDTISRACLRHTRNTNTPEVNSNTLSFCAPHQSGAVCTKTANPETGACRRRVAPTRLVSPRPEPPKHGCKRVEVTHGDWRCFPPPLRPVCAGASREPLGPLSAPGRSAKWMWCVPPSRSVGNLRDGGKAQSRPGVIHPGGPGGRGFSPRHKEEVEMRNEIIFQLEKHPEGADPPPAAKTASISR